MTHRHPFPSERILQEIPRSVLICAVSLICGVSIIANAAVPPPIVPDGSVSIEESQKNETPEVTETEPPFDNPSSDNPSNDPPVNTVPGSQVTPRNVPLTFSALNGNALLVNDPDAGDGNLKVSLSVSRGSLTVEADSDAVVEGNGTSGLVLTGSPAAINVELDGLRYHPPPDWHGEVTLIMESDDLGNTGPPGPLTDRDEVEITVAVTTGPDQPPVADAGPDFTVNEYRRVDLDGSGSFDPDGSDGRPIGFEWIQTGGNRVDLENPESPVASFSAPGVPPESEVLTFSLTVFDSRNQRDTDHVEVTVQDIGAPVGTFSEGSTVILDASETGEATAYFHWSQISGPSVTLSDEASARTRFVAPIVDPPGAMLVFELTRRDAEGETIFEEVPVRIEDNGITGFPPEVLTFTPILTTRMGITVAGGDLVSLQGRDPAEIKETFNRPQSLIHGLVDAQIKAGASGDEVSVTFYLPEPAGAGFSWFVYTENEGWFDAGPDAVFSPDRKTVSVAAADGGRVDRDEAVNGMIRMVSGLGSPGASDPSGSGGSGENGGCYIRSASD